MDIHLLKELRYLEEAYTRIYQLIQLLRRNFQPHFQCTEINFIRNVLTDFKLVDVWRIELRCAKI